MIFPPRLDKISSVTRSPRLRKPSHAQQDEAPTPVPGPASVPAMQKKPAALVRPSRKIPLASGRSFSAQLLEMGLHHGMKDLIREVGDEPRPRFISNTALRLYEQAQADFIADERVALYTHFKA